jgi:hypothetical protein
MPALRELRDRLLRTSEYEALFSIPSKGEPAFVDRAAEWTALTRVWSSASRAQPALPAAAIAQ